MTSVAIRAQCHENLHLTQSMLRNTLVLPEVLFSPNIMSRHGKKGHRGGGPLKTKSQPTHFLCLPIVNATSKQQLADSVGRFRFLTGQHSRHQALSPKGTESSSAQRWVIPDSAFRPLGTLHLTLGVMHLTTKVNRTKSGQRLAGDLEERTPPRPGSDSDALEPKQHAQSSPGAEDDTSKTLEDAIFFLRGLNLASMLAQHSDSTVGGSQGTRRSKNPEEAEGDRSLRKEGARGAGATPCGEAGNDDTKPQTPKSEPQENINPDPIAPVPLASFHKPISPPPGHSKAPEYALPEPIKISLSGLSCFPSATKATVVHIPPHDPTNRLIPFAESLRDAFVSEGFLQPEKRALKLHASVVNTIYAGRDRRRPGQRVDGEITNNDNKGTQQDTDEARNHEENDQIEHSEQDHANPNEPDAEHNKLKARLQPTQQFLTNQQQPSHGRTKRKQRHSRMTIDAREILKAFNHHGGRPTTSPPEDTKTITMDETIPSSQSSHNLPIYDGADQNEPYVWATDVLIDRVRICKMGAKPTRETDDGIQLGQEYELVAEKMIVS